MVYKNCKVYGPYKRKDNRSHVIIIFPDKTRKTVSYPKYLTELRINKYLLGDKTIDHVDNNFKNNTPRNIRIIERSKHAKLDAKRLKKQKFTCPECNLPFSLDGVKLHNAIRNRKNGKSGPFCSKRCSGIYSCKIKLGKTKKLNVKLIKPSYFRIKEII